MAYRFVYGTMALTEAKHKKQVYVVTNGNQALVRCSRGCQGGLDKVPGESTLGEFG